MMGSTTEPVRVGGAVGAAVQGVWPALLAVLLAFDVWHPTDAQLAALGGLYVALLVLVQAVVTAWQRSKVTPVAANAVDRARQDGAVLAAQALARNDVPSAVAALVGTTPHDLRYANGEPVVAPPPAAGTAPPASRS